MTGSLQSCKPRCIILEFHRHYALRMHDVSLLVSRKQVLIIAFELGVIGSGHSGRRDITNEAFLVYFTLNHLILNNKDRHCLVLKTDERRSLGIYQRHITLEKAYLT